MHEMLPTTLTTRDPYAPSTELVERKGTGHPDTLCDALAESLARRLATALVASTGTLPHFNVDKGLLVAGDVEVDFGGGRLIEPALVILAGRADPARWSIDLAAIHDGLRADLRSLVPDAPPDAFGVELRLRRPSYELDTLVTGRAGTVPLANDTSLAVVSLPRSPLEELVHEVERHLASQQVRRQLPIGPDVKVMGRRADEDVALTVAVALLAGRVMNRGEYDAVVAAVAEEVRDVSARLLGHPADVAVNCADALAPYLTLSGTSAEAGDDGQVGRGNRFGGLITPYRHMSLEATAGKHPAAHVGKTYHCIAFDIATRLLAETRAREATVVLLSRIGSPVTEPQAVHVETVGTVSEATVALVASECLAEWAGVRDRLVAGAYELF
jgi:S-adenosylmethionine synthetase